MRKTQPQKNFANFYPFIIGISLAALLLLVILAATISGYYGYLKFSNRTLPGVTIAGEKVGTLSYYQLRSILDNKWHTENVVLVTDGIHQVYMSPVELGLHVDLEETITNALYVGSGGNTKENITEILEAIMGDIDVPIVASLDIDQARTGMQSLIPLMSLPPTDATIQVSGDQLIALPGNYGYTINIDESINLLSREGKTILENGIFNLQLKPVLPRITDVSQALNEGEKLLATPVEISTYDPVYNERISWIVPKEEIAEWIVVEKAELRPILRFDPDKIAEYLTLEGRNLGSAQTINGAMYAQEVIQSIEANRTADVTVSHLPTTYQVQPGDTLLRIGWQLGFPFWMIMDANPGINPDALNVGETLIIPSKDDLLPLPIIPEKRIVISINEQRLRTYENDILNSTHIISTGMDRSPTQPGVFQVQTHELNAYASVWDLTMPHFLGIYEAWPGFMNGIHGLPTLSSGRRLWANVLGKPASYGCIILDLNEAEWLYNWAEQGVIVEIVP